MTVLSVITGQPKPGRFDDAIEMNRKTKKVLERHGAKNIRNLTAMVSGAAFGSIVSSSEFDDTEAWGAWFDAIMADEELVAILSHARSDKTPWATLSSQVVTEVPLQGRKRGPNGAILVAYVSAPVPGRYPAALALAEQAAELLERQGGRNCRVFSQQASGVQPEVLITTVEYDTMRAYGKGLDSFLGDPSGQAIVTATQGSDSPVRLLTTEVFTEIPG
jgi:hypothetical protein